MHKRFHDRHLYQESRFTFHHLMMLGIIDRRRDANPNLGKGSPDTRRKVLETSTPNSWAKAIEKQRPHQSQGVIFAQGCRNTSTFKAFTWLYQDKRSDEPVCKSRSPECVEFGQNQLPYRLEPDFHPRSLIKIYGGRQLVSASTTTSQRHATISKETLENLNSAIPIPDIESRHPSKPVT